MPEFKTLQQLACVPRGETEELRLELTESTSETGEVRQFVGARVWFRGDRGDMLPGKQGLTIRKDEIRDVGRALKTALEVMTGEVGRGRTQPAAPQRPAPSPRGTSDGRTPEGRQVGGQRGAPSRRYPEDDDEDGYAGGRL